MRMATLRELGFSKSLDQHVQGHSQLQSLGIRCQPPCYWKSSPLSARPITPLWECGTTFVYFDNDACVFEKVSLEELSHIWFRYRSPQAVLANLFTELYEDELSGDELREVASRLEFRHIDRFLAEAPLITGRAYEEWVKRFPSTCED